MTLNPGLLTGILMIISIEAHVLINIEYWIRVLPFVTVSQHVKHIIDVVAGLQFGLQMIGKIGKFNDKKLVIWLRL